MKFKLNIFLTAALICCLTAAAAFAVENNINGVSTAAAAQGGDVGNGVKWYYDGKGTTTFSYTGSGSGEIPNGGSRLWEAVKNDTVFLRIESGITRIGDDTFKYSIFRRDWGWKNLYMADTVKTIGNRAFNGCFDICTFRLSKNLEEIGDAAFVNPSAMTSITIPSKVKKIGARAFQQAFSLRVLTFEVPKPANYHDLDIGEDAFQYRVEGNRKGTVKIAYTSETGILADRNTGEELPDGAVLSEDLLSNRALTWVKHTPTNYIITYDPNGGRMTGGISTVRVPVNSTIKLHTQSQLGLAYIGRDLVFKGWSTDENATKAEYQDGAEYTATDDVTLYAVWGDHYDITFDANGGTFSIDSPKQEFKKDETKPLMTAAELGLSSPGENLYFIGWATSKERASSLTVDYKDGADFKPTADMTLYAVWETKFVVKFDPNEEKGGRFTSTETEIEFLQGEIVRLTTAQTLGLYNISEDENFFVGWSTVKNGLVQYDDGVTLTPDSDMTLYAVWSDGGDGSEGNPFIIDSYNRLKKLAKDTNDYTNYFYQGTYFKLTVNIDATSEDWTPIGKNYNYSFNGHFNGGNHFISYKINDSDAHNQGLFGYLDGGSIKNLSIYANITGAGDYVGGIVGFVGFDAVVKNCYTTVNLTSTAETDYWSESTNLGGIAGANWGTIEYCSVFGSLLRDNDNEEIRLGGIAGVNNGGTLSNCASFSGLGTTECYIGMITGDNEGEEFYPGTIENCCYDIIMAGKYKGVGYEEGTKDVSGTTAMTRAQLSAYAKSISDDYALYREGILLGIASGGSGEEFSDTTDFGKSDVDVTDSAIAGKVLDALKKANSAISSLTSGDVYDLITAAYISGDVSIGEQRTSADISEDDKKIIGDVKYIAVLPKITVSKAGVYVFIVPITNMPETTPIVFHSLKQSSGEVQAASSSEQDYIFIDENVNEITTVPSSRNVNTAAYFEAGTYAPVIAGGTVSTGSGKGSSSGCNAGFGFGLAALLLVPFVKKFKFKS